MNSVALLFDDLIFTTLFPRFFPSLCEVAEKWILLDSKTSPESSYTSQLRIGTGNRQSFS